jgi:hypothetical protein
MSHAHSLRLHVLLTALGLGVLADAWLRAVPLGINLLLWALVATAATLALAVRHRVALCAKAGWMLTAGLVAAAALAWRDAPILKLLNLLAFALAVALASWQARWGSVVAGGLFDHGWRLLTMGLNAVCGPVPWLGGDAPCNAGSAGGWSAKARAVSAGVLLAIPLLVVFGALFMSADAVFHQLVSRILRVDFSSVIPHVVFTGGCAWAVSGGLGGLLLKDKSSERTPSLPQFTALGGVEINTALALVNLLFAAFILVQIRYLFGGARLVEVTPALTYAEYARRGFFELVAVAALTLVLLLVSDWALGRGSKRAFRLQALALVLMVGVIMVSALRRMRLYQEAFGLTELRLYVTAFMLWLAVVFVGFVVLVLRGRRERFCFLAFGAAYGALMLLNGLNPHDCIARTNLQRGQAGRRFDAHYLASLSADAFPALAQALPRLPPDDQQLLAQRLRRWQAGVRNDWRAWSWSRKQAMAAIQANQLAIDRLANAAESK